MTAASRRWHEALATLRTWKRGEKRAVNKPLMLILLIGRAERGGDPRVRFADIHGPLSALLDEFGPPRKTHHPEYPFWHLHSDGLFMVEDRDAFSNVGRASPSKGALIARDAAGLVPPDLREASVDEPNLRAELVENLLHMFWPVTLHDALCSAVGLSLSVPQRASHLRLVRDSKFRDCRPRCLRAQLCGVRL